MIVLALETSTPFFSLALARGEEVLWEHGEAGTSFSARLFPLLADALRSLGLGPGEVGAVAVGRGPGSYTGLRLGMTVAKGWALERGIPLLAPGTLELLAYQAGPRAGPVAALLPLRSGQVWRALYRWSGGELEEVLPPRRYEPEELEREADPAWFCVGPAYSRLRERGLSGFTYRPSAASLAQMAFGLLARGQTVDPLRVLPFYGE